MPGQNLIILPHEGSHKGRIKIHSYFQSTAMETVCNGSNGTAHNVPLDLEVGIYAVIHEGETLGGRIAGDGQEFVPKHFPAGFHIIQVKSLGQKLLRAQRTAAVKFAAHAAHEGLGADTVQEHAIETAVAEVVVVDGHHVGDILGIRRAVEAESLAGRQVIIGGDVAPEVHSGGVLAHFLCFGKNRQPQKHLDVFPVQVCSHLSINLFFQTPAYDDLFHRNEPANGIQPADNLFGGIIRRMPAAQGNLDNIRRFFNRFVPARGQCQQPHQDNCDFFHFH